MDEATNPTAEQFPVFALKNNVLFPNMAMPVTASRPTTIAAVDAAVATEDKQLAVFTQRDASVETPGADDLQSIGVLSGIRHVQKREGVYQLMLLGGARVERVEVLQTTPYPLYRVRELPEPDDYNPEVEALHRSLLDLAAHLLTLAPPNMQLDLQQMTSELGKPYLQAYVLASLTSMDNDKLGQLLSASTQAEALRLVIDGLRHEVQVLEVQRQISSAVDTSMSEEHRRVMLRQQLREIQAQLGEQDPEQAEIEELKRRLGEAGLPELVRIEMDKELTRLQRMSPNAGDYQTSRSYIDLVLDLPWRKTTEDRIDLAAARNVLDEDHFDLKEVKDRIIEHLAVMKLNPGAKAPILCFVGPPGVGKTSLGQSIARTLGRVFERMSLGGLHDEAELRGHRRTYVGAMPGRIIRAMRRGGVKNPLLMLDEIDKLGRDFRGDPASALMEILDPSQNSDFQDNYLDLPFDLSQVFFIATANALDTIPGPLLDRIEVLRLSGYSEQEKREIARRFMLDKRIGEAGLKTEQLRITDEVLEYVIRNYTREAGVRSLDRALARITRKVAARFATDETQAPIELSTELVMELLGPPHLSWSSRREDLPPGVIAGLAWTESGGDVLYVEAALLPQAKELMLTGQLGNVMQESARAAYSYLWSRAERLGLDPARFTTHSAHIHVPAGATPKDGPSAGVTMASALASAFSGHAARNDTAMTGEISLSGLVLPVGGIKDKVLAAHRAGLRRIILPRDNEHDLDELPPEVRESLEFILVDSVPEVLRAAIPGFENLDSDRNPG